MKTVFADAGYWIANFNPRDEWHENAKTATAQLGKFRVVTSQMVLVEFLTHCGGSGQELRVSAANVVNDLVIDPNVEIVPQSSAQFDLALERYSSRPDKNWSLTDCASFLVMEELSIREALAYDRDFEQAGFIALLRQSNPAF